MEIKYINKDTEKYKLIFSNVTLKAGSKVILENESFNITYNNMVILKGPIGSGKSSILKAIAGIYHLENGEISVSITLKMVRFHLHVIMRK